MFSKLSFSTAILCYSQWWRRHNALLLAFFSPSLSLENRICKDYILQAFMHLSPVLWIMEVFVWKNMICESKEDNNTIGSFYYMVRILRPSGGLAYHLNWIKLVKNWVMGACWNLCLASGLNFLWQGWKTGLLWLVWISLVSPWWQYYHLKFSGKSWICVHGLI